MRTKRQCPDDPAKNIPDRSGTKARQMKTHERERVTLIFFFFYFFVSFYCLLVYFCLHDLSAGLHKQSLTVCHEDL